MISLIITNNRQVFLDEENVWPQIKILTKTKYCWWSIFHRITKLVPLSQKQGPLSWDGLRHMINTSKLIDHVRSINWSSKSFLKPNFVNNVGWALKQIIEKWDFIDWCRKYALSANWRGSLDGQPFSKLLSPMLAGDQGCFITNM